MYRQIIGVLVIILSVVISGCANTKADDIPSEIQRSEQEENGSLFAGMPEHFVFCSGAGAWSTEITLSEDGSFQGYYHDTDMGDTGKEYPYGTVYLCEFEGKFSEPVKADGPVYECSVERLEWDKDKTEEIVEGIRYLYSEPYGLSASAKIRIYLPGTPIAEVEEGFLSWSSIYSKQRKYLPEGFFGIYNADGEYGFVGIKDDVLWSHKYVGAIGDVEIRLYPGYDTSYLHFVKGNDYYSLHFDWYDDAGTDFVAKDWEGEDEYDIHLERSEDLAEVKVTLKNRAGANMEQWGGSAEGELTVDLKKMDETGEEQ